MLKKNKWLFILSSAVILLPILAGLLLWNRLPEPMPIHFGMNGEADGWGSRAMAVFSPPLILLAGQLVILLCGRLDSRFANVGEKPLQLLFWILPAASLIANAMIYCSALNIPLNINLVGMLTLGCMSVMLGNVLPKVKPNAVFGIRLPTTLSSPENWRLTHRVGGWSMSIGGLVMVLAGFLQLWWLFITAMAVSILIPIIYSITRRTYERDHH